MRGVCRRHWCSRPHRIIIDWNLDRVFDEIRNAGLNISLENSQFVKYSLELLGKTTWTAGVAPIGECITKFLKNLKLPSSVKTLHRFLGFVNFYKQYIPRLADKLVPLQLLLRKDVPFNLTQQQKNTFFEMNESLLKLSLKLRLPGN